MKIEVVNIETIKPNPDNPRVIKGDQLEKLKKSIQEFPEMLEARPLVVDENLVVIGGNMRLRALKELGYKDIPIIRFSNLDEAKKREFVVKDNVNYGEWNWDSISTSWDVSVVSDWGLEIPAWVMDDEMEPEIDEDVLSRKLEKYLDSQIRRITLFFSQAEYEEAINKLDQVMEGKRFKTNTEAFIFLMNYYLENDRD
jgi:hypothetical protein